ncbi:hypothetical protein TNCV_2709351 [Trichonephila clavipes]|nr:hypothetical protein TNCV_2709351 [Trichonephila clavipes]
MPNAGIGITLYDAKLEGDTNFQADICAILFVPAAHQVALPHINFCPIQSIAKVPTMMPTWFYRQYFAVFPLNHQYDVLLMKVLSGQSSRNNRENLSRKTHWDWTTEQGLQDLSPSLIL